MATTIANLAPSQGQSTDLHSGKSLLKNLSSAFKSVTKSTQKKLSSAGTTLLARVVFGQPNFNFLDIPTANLKVTQQEIIDDLNERMP